MTSQVSKVGLAILGAGLFAKEAHVPALVNLRNLTDLRAVYSRSSSSAQSLAKEAEKYLGVSDLSVYSDDTIGLDQLLARSDIQAVLVVLPITTQPSIILKALEAGKHVLSEKPVAATVEEGKTLIAEYEAKYEQKGLIWRIAENYEAEPGNIAIAKAIRSGKIGEVVHFNLVALNNMDKNSKWYKTPWRTVPDYQGGFLLDGGVHSAAELRMLLPSPLAQLSGHASLIRDYLAPQDTLTGILKSEDGSYGTFELTFAAPTGSLSAKRNGLIIMGTKGWIEKGRERGDIKATIHIASEKENEADQLEVIQEASCGVEKEIESFVRAVLGENDGLGLGGPRGALKDVAIIEAGLNSHGVLIDLLDMTKMK